MSLPLNSKYFRVSLITFGATTLFLAFGFFKALWPYQSWFQPVSIVYQISLIVFSVLIVICNLYSLIAWVLSKRRNKSLNSAVAIGPTISVTILFLYVCSPYMPQFLPNGSHLQAFNSELWIADDSIIVNDGITVRQKMLGDVVENVLPGKSRNEIIRLLGLSSDDSYQSTLLFYLGPARGDSSGIEVEHLRVYLDHSKKYEKYEFVWGSEPSKTLSFTNISTAFG
jgi:hypothetical protein